MCLFFKRVKTFLSRKRKGGFSDSLLACHAWVPRCNFQQRKQNRTKINNKQNQPQKDTLLSNFQGASPCCWRRLPSCAVQSLPTFRLQTSLVKDDLPCLVTPKRIIFRFWKKEEMTPLCFPSRVGLSGLFETLALKANFSISPHLPQISNDLLHQGKINKTSSSVVPKFQLPGTCRPVYVAFLISVHTISKRTWTGGFA